MNNLFDRYINAHISISLKTLKFIKTECGVDVLLNVGFGYEHKDIFLDNHVFNTDTFEILFFKKGKGYLILNQKRIDITDNSIIFISTFQERQWYLDPDHLDFTFLVFQEDFLNDFFADKLFTYKLLYFYQHDYPLILPVSSEEMQKVCSTIVEIKTELIHTRFDSEHIIRSLLYYLLLKLNRQYAWHYHIPLDKPDNNYAFQFKKLLETHIRDKQRIVDYTILLGISRITLNKAVNAQFGMTATHLLKQRLLFEIKNQLIHSSHTIAEISDNLHFSEPNHLMRFFKTRTGMTTSQFISAYQNSSLS